MPIGKIIDALVQTGTYRSGERPQSIAQQSHQPEQRCSAPTSTPERQRTQHEQSRTPLTEQEHSQAPLTQQEHSRTLLTGKKLSHNLPTSLAAGPYSASPVDSAGQSMAARRCGDGVVDRRDSRQEPGFRSS